MHRGDPSPLHNIKAAVVSTIKHICFIQHSLTLTQGLTLVNIMIKGTDTQKYLVQFKIKIAILTEKMTIIRLALDIGTAS